MHPIAKKKRSRGSKSPYAEKNNSSTADVSLSALSNCTEQPPRKKAKVASTSPALEDDDQAASCLASTSSDTAFTRLRSLPSASAKKSSPTMQSPSSSSLPPQNWLLPSHVALEILSFVPVKFWPRIAQVSRFWCRKIQLAFADVRDVDSTKFFIVSERQRRCRPSMIQERLVEFLRYLGQNCFALERLQLRNRVDLRVNLSLRFPVGDEFPGWRNIREFALVGVIAPPKFVAEALTQFPLLECLTLHRTFCGSYDPALYFERSGGGKKFKTANEMINGDLADAVKNLSNLRRLNLNGNECYLHRFLDEIPADRLVELHIENTECMTKNLIDLLLRCAELRHLTLVWTYGRMEHPLGFGSFNSSSVRRPTAGCEKKAKGGGLNFSSDLLAILPELPKLESLNLSNLKREFVRGAISLQKFAEILRNCPQLKSLNLNGSDFFKVPLMIEKGEILLRLTRLEFCDHNATPTTFTHLAAFRNLETLNVAKGSPESGFGYPSGVNETLLQIFGQNLLRLKRLNLGFIRGDAATLGHLAPLDALESLTFTVGRLLDSDLSLLAGNHGHSLKELLIYSVRSRNDSTLSDRGIVEFAENSPGIESIRLPFYKNSDLLLRFFARNWLRLEKIVICGGLITESGLAKFARKCGKLRSIVFAYSSAPWNQSNEFAWNFSELLPHVKVEEVDYA